MILFKICFSIIKKNKGFTFCLFLMSLLCIAVSVITSNFGLSSKKSFDNYFLDCGTPDAIVQTLPTEKENFSYIQDYEGVKEINTRLVIESNLETQDGKQFSSRLITYDENWQYKLTIHSHKDIDTELPKISLYYRFAEYNNINVGDEITVFGSLGTVKCIVESTISSPETFNCIKDNFSSYENYQFCYMYMREATFQKTLNYSSKTNSVLIYFDDDVPLESQKQTLKEIENSLGENLLTSVLLIDSDGYKKVEEDVKTIDVLCVFVPGIVMIVSLGFSFIFIKIIVENQKSTIALLKSLGYSSKKVTCIFILFTLIINLFALIVGVPVGYALLNSCVGLILKAQGVLSVSLTFNALPTIGLIILVFLISIVASLLTSRSISKIDPSLIKSTDNDNHNAPKFAKAIKCHPFVKISLVSTLKNYKRLIIGGLCLAFCITAIGIGVQGVLTNGYHADAVFGERLQYDLMVRDIDETTYNDIKSNVSGIEIIEPASLFVAEVNNVNVNVSSFSESTTLIKLVDKDGNKLLPNNGVVIDEMYSVINNVNVGDSILLDGHKLEVNGVARELMNNYFYVSEETASNIFSISTNCAYIKASNPNEIEKIKDDITNINKDVYFTVLSLQNKNLADRSFTMEMVMGILALLSFAMGSLFVFNMAIIDFNEKKSKFATLRALGASVDKICIVTLIENLLRLFIGIIVAIPTCYIISSQIFARLSNQFRQYISVNYWGCFFGAVAVSFIYILVAYLISRRKIRKMDLLEKLNEVE